MSGMSRYGPATQPAQPWHLFALRAVQGLVAGYGPLTVSMAAMSAPAERMARAIGAVQTAQRIGPAVGPVLGGLLAAAVGLRDAFLVAAAVYAGAFVMVAFLIGSAISPILSGLVASRSIRVVFLSGAAILTLIVVMVRRLMAERDPVIEAARQWMRRESPVLLCEFLVFSPTPWPLRLVLVHPASLPWEWHSRS